MDRDVTSPSPFTLRPSPFKLRPYPAYQDSGVPWLGEVPAHWNQYPLFAITRTKNSRGRPDLPLLSVYRDYGVILRDSRDDNYNPKSADLTPYKVVSPSDLVLNKMKTWQGSLGVSEHLGIVSPAYIVCELYGDLAPRFIHHLLRSKPYIGHYNRLSFGVRVNQWDMRYDDFKRIPVFLPPLSEQRAIAAFLTHIDRVTRRYIRGQRRLIELLKEQKQALIQQAVTRGLDPDVPLKESGIEWVPMIPEHWETIRLGHLAALLQTGPFGSQLHSHEYQTNGIPVINPSHMKNGKIIPDMDCAVSSTKASELARHRLQSGDIIFARRGELGRCALVGNQEVGWLCGTGSLCLRLKDKGISNPSYFVTLFLSKGVGEWLSLQSVGSTMENLNTGILSRLPLPLPPESEQKAIVEYTVHQQRLFDGTIDRTQRRIDLIREYRTRLIADVVTGKLDVRSVKL